MTELELYKYITETTIQDVIGYGQLTPPSNLDTTYAKEHEDHYAVLIPFVVEKSGLAAVLAQIKQNEELTVLTNIEANSFWRNVTPGNFDSFSQIAGMTEHRLYADMQLEECLQHALNYIPAMVVKALKTEVSDERLDLFMHDYYLAALRTYFPYLEVEIDYDTEPQAVLFNLKISTLTDEQKQEVINNIQLNDSKYVLINYV